MNEEEVPRSVVIYGGSMSIKQGTRGGRALEDVFRDNLKFTQYLDKGRE